MYRTYFILGLLNSVISISRMIGLTTLPPTLYVVAANTEIIFEALLTRFYLHRTVTRLQMMAVLCVVLGVAISLYATPSMRQQQEEEDEANTNQDADGDVVGVRRSLVVGVSLTLVSRLASALNTVLADKLLGDDRKTYMGVLECSIGNALVPSLTLPWLLLVAPEYKSWPEQLHASSQNNAATTTITLLFFSLCISKYIDRVSKFYIIGKTSTLFFAVIDANMKIIAGIGAFILFGEIIFWPKILGFCFIAISLFISVYEKFSIANYGLYHGLNSNHSSTASEDGEDEELAIGEGFSMQPILLTNNSGYYTSVNPQFDGDGCDDDDDDGNSGFNNDDCAIPSNIASESNPLFTAI